MRLLRSRLLHFVTLRGLRERTMSRVDSKTLSGDSHRGLSIIPGSSQHQIAHETAHALERRCVLEYMACKPTPDMLRQQ